MMMLFEGKKVSISAFWIRSECECVRSRGENVTEKNLIPPKFLSSVNCLKKNGEPKIDPTKDFPLNIEQADQILRTQGRLTKFTIFYSFRPP